MKKTLLIILMLSLLACNNKNETLDLPCEHYLVENKDEFRGQTFYESKLVFLHDLEDEVIGKLFYTSIDFANYYLQFELVDKICLESNSQITFLFEDESLSSDFIQDTPKCDNVYIIHNPVFSNFKTKKLKGFRISSGVNYKDYYISESTKDELIKTTNCYLEIAHGKSLNK